MLPISIATSSHTFQHARVNMIRMRVCEHNDEPNSPMIHQKRANTQKDDRAAKKGKIPTEIVDDSDFRMDQLRTFRFANFRMQTN